MPWPRPPSPAIFAASGVRELLAGHHEADVRDAARLQSAVPEAAARTWFFIWPRNRWCARATPARATRSR